VVHWARGRAFGEILALDPRAPAALDPFFERVEAPEGPDDAREKLEYALLALHGAVRDHLGRSSE
ncbi:MAG: hypothetical protein ACC662_11920, partial [Planctomycetota bacterium]